MQDTIAIVFDFDDTLASDSTSSFLKSVGLNPPQFWSERVQPKLDAGWDPILAYLDEMIVESKQRRAADRITQKQLAEWGKQVELFPGVTTLFRAVREHAHQVNANVTVEFYLVSSGIREIVANSKIANHFTDIWASDFSYKHGTGEIEAVKNAISFTDKTRFLFHVSKGIHGPESRRLPFEVNKKVPDADLRVPLNQMIFVGDGYTDVPCFSMVRKAGGHAIGVFDRAGRSKWGRAWGFIEDGRVSNLVPAEYGASSALRTTLLMAVGNMAQHIELRRASYQG